MTTMDLNVSPLGQVEGIHALQRAAGDGLVEPGRPERPVDRGGPPDVQDAVEFWPGDVRDRGDVDRAVAGCDVAGEPGDLLSPLRIIRLAGEEVAVE